MLVIEVRSDDGSNNVQSLKSDPCIARGGRAGREVNLGRI